MDEEALGKVGAPIRTELEHARVGEIHEQYEKNYVRYQALAGMATGTVPPYVWPHDADINRVGRARVLQWMQEQLTAIRVEANRRLQRTVATRQQPLKYTPLFADEPNVTIPVTMNADIGDKKEDGDRMHQRQRGKCIPLVSSHGNESDHHDASQSSRTRENSCPTGDGRIPLG